jgi:ribosomal protein S18 acetylase RimI-like enzyme
MTSATPGWGIRRAILADVPRLKDLGVLGWETTYAHIVRPENRSKYLAGPFWSHATLSSVVSNPDCLTLVAATDGAALGFLTVEPVEPDIVELTRFYVDPGQRRSGIGSALFAAALEWSRDRSARSMIVNVFADNTVGCAFYERAGFRLSRLCPFTVGDQVVRDAWYELNLVH